MNLLWICDFCKFYIHFSLKKYQATLSKFFWGKFIVTLVRKIYTQTWELQKHLVHDL